jgi:1-deoxy-D-xylulose-5-phosphate synthase
MMRIEHGEQIELHHECGFDAEHIEKAVLQMLEPAYRQAGLL